MSIFEGKVSAFNIKRFSVALARGTILKFESHIKRSDQNSLSRPEVEQIVVTKPSLQYLQHDISLIREQQAIIKMIVLSQ